ncbi:response regulator transcription factor [Alloalcanivorax sp. C16-2]|uniref:response regulator n=1 Tax=Alloalcanivorax TaxID=3020832 RepID=UPI001933AC42|nr:response regulator transcription factor [Alloalcanivorax marinus]
MADRPLRVAVVEDYGPMRALLVRELVAGGFRAVGYPDAASLWRHFPGEVFDLVVLNIGLPDEDGFSVSRRLRRESRIPVVMVSGYGSNEHQLLGLREGADAYLVKPVDIHVLVATLERLARRLRLEDRGAPPRSAGWWLAEDGWLLRTPDNREIALNGHERVLLSRLLAAAGAWVPDPELVSALAGQSRPGERPVPARLFRRLRRKIAAFTGLPPPLESRAGAHRFATLINEDAYRRRWSP